MTDLVAVSSQTDSPALTVTFGLIALAVYIIGVIALWRVFTKAGYPGWLVLIPIVNTFVLVKIAGFSAWYGLLYFVPIVNIVFHVIVSLRIGKGFGQSTAFSIVLLWLFSLVGFFILGYGSAQYDRNRIPVLIR